MATTNRRELTEQEQRRAAVFRRAWDAKKEAQKLTQEDAGESLDMTPSGFGQYVNGKVAIGLKAALALCKYLRVSLEEAEIESLVEASPEDLSLPDDVDVEELFNQLSPENLESVMSEFMSSLSVGQRIRVAQIALAGLSVD